MAYEIPRTLTDGKQVTVKIKGDGNSKGGGIFYAYTFAKGLPASSVAMQAGGFPPAVCVDEGGICLRSTDGQPLHGRLSLYNVWGQAIVEHEAVAGLDEYRIDAPLCQGVYLLLFKPDTQPAYSTKVVVS